ncbi:hypothetical protein D3C85_1375470 [compost metagenome]
MAVVEQPVVEETTSPAPTDPVAPEVEKPAAKPKKAWNDPKPKEDKPVKNITLEITNPDDLEIDDKGQLGLF